MVWEGLKLFDEKLSAQGPFPMLWNKQKRNHLLIFVTVNKFLRRTPEIRCFVFTVIYKKVEHFVQDRVCCVRSVPSIGLASLQEEEMFMYDGSFGSSTKMTMCRNMYLSYRDHSNSHMWTLSLLPTVTRPYSTDVQSVQLNFRHYCLWHQCLKKVGLCGQVSMCKTYSSLLQQWVNVGCAAWNKWIPHTHTQIFFHKRGKKTNTIILVFLKYKSGFSPKFIYTYLHYETNISP